MQSFIVDRLYERLRLDQYLVERMMVFSRSDVQTMIRNRRVTVNRKEVKSNYLLKFQDRIEVNEKGVTSQVEKDQPKVEKRRSVITNLPKPVVVDTTQQYFILDKPAGWLMHQATEYDKTPLISDFVLELDPSIRSVGDRPDLRPGIVHRLDKDVSGLIVITRTQSFFDHIKNQFIRKAVYKTYTALVFGHPGKDEDTIEFRIGRSNTKAKMAAVPKDDNRGKDAVTHFEVLERFQHTTLLKVWVETGRTNQIRAHLGAYNLPIVGDTVYGPKSKANSALGRVMLHANYITFYDLGGEKKEYTSEIPQAFQVLVDKGRQYVRKS